MTVNYHKIFEVIHNDDQEGLIKVLKYQDPNHLDTWDADTPLQAACRKGRYECAKILIEHGANIHCGAWYGSNVIDIAIKHKHPNIIRLLFEKGARPQKHFSSVYLKDLVRKEIFKITMEISIGLKSMRLPSILLYSIVENVLNKNYLIFLPSRYDIQKITRMVKNY